MRTITRISIVCFTKDRNSEKFIELKGKLKALIAKQTGGSAMSV
jgi:hypothetical protein